MSERRDLMEQFFELGIVRFGDFRLKSGIRSPFYVDLRAIASRPDLLAALSRQLLARFPEKDFDLICGVPYAALPLATAMSLDSGVPLIMKRKETKAYGTKKLIEGIYHSGQSALVVEDVITSGKSLLETIPALKEEGLQVRDIAVVIDRQQGGRARLERAGYRVRALFTIRQLIDGLYEAGKLDAAMREKVLQFLEQHRQVDIAPAARPGERMPAHPVARRLVDIRREKQTHLICSADVTTAHELLALAAAVGPHIAALKVHADIIEDFSPALIKRLRALAQDHRFLLFEDRKLADIGHTAVIQLTKGVHHIADWADMVTVHVTAGEGSIVALKRAAPEIGIVPIVQMSTADTLTDAHYRQRAMEVVLRHTDAVVGVVAQDHPVPPHLLKFTPGVHLDVKGDKKGQRYHTPEKVFGEYGTDFIIVGRGIYRAADPAATAARYRERARQAATARRE